MSSLTLGQSNTIINAALKKAREMKFAPLAVVVLDASGDLIAAQREDGASMFRVDVATGKAWASIGMDAPSRILAERAAGNPNFFVALAATGQGRFLPQPGAVLIRDANGRIIGAAGASGGTGDEDEAACIAGVLAAGLVSEPAKPSLP
ncbi:MAG: heme-binding protein [Burkholderiaceae bacterium]